MHRVISMKSIAKQLNDWTYTDYYYRLMLIARSVFKWEGLPNHMNEKWIERFLFNEGRCIFFDDKTRGFMVTKCTESGKLNEYDEATFLRPFATGEVFKSLEKDVNCVLIQNNDLMLSTSPTIQLYAYRLAEIQRTIDVNISAQKTPIAILCSEKQRLSMKRTFEQVNDNEIAIYGDKNLDIEGIKTLKLDAPIVFDKLQSQKQNVWNECMTFLGINNNSQEAKRERLVVNEVDANNEQIESSAEVFLKAREKACEQINEMFGLNISVRMRQMKTPTLEEFEGGSSDDNE